MNIFHPSIPLPRLKELITHQISMLGPTSLSGLIFWPCHELRHLHTFLLHPVDSGGLLGYIGKLTPSLYLTGVQLEPLLACNLEVAAGIWILPTDLEMVADQKAPSKREESPGPPSCGSTQPDRTVASP